MLGYCLSLKGREFPLEPTTKLDLDSGAKERNRTIRSPELGSCLRRVGSSVDQLGGGLSPLYVAKELPSLQELEQCCGGVNSDLPVACLETLRGE